MKDARRRHHYQYKHIKNGEMRKKNTKTRLTLTMDERYHRIKCEICLDL